MISKQNRPSPDSIASDAAAAWWPVELPSVWPFRA